jgi:hypothetical protein
MVPMQINQDKAIGIDVSKATWLSNFPRLKIFINPRESKTNCPISQR